MLSALPNSSGTPSIFQTFLLEKMEVVGVLFVCLFKFSKCLLESCIQGKSLITADGTIDLHYVHVFSLKLH